MDNQHKQIKGCRELTQVEIDLMNQIKNMGDSIQGMVEAINSIDGADKRWVSIAATDFQTGLMALTRAVTRPESF
jgi:hypothetical protein